MKVGNDIVDIKEAHLKSDWRRRGFIEKIFDQKEQILISVSPDPFLTIWRMWSMKESAYKLFLQNRRERFFNPRRIHCEFASSDKGKVRIEDLLIHTNTQIHSHYIFTSASMKREDGVQSVVFYLTKTDHRFQREMTHQKALQNLSRSHHLELGKLEIRKTDQNIPVLFYKGEHLNIPVSLTHHGHFGAFSWGKANFAPDLDIH